MKQHSKRYDARDEKDNVYIESTLVPRYPGYATEPDSYKRFNFAIKRMESPVTKISVHLEDCQQLTYINWLMLIDSVVTFYGEHDQLRKEPRITVNTNSTYTLLYNIEASKYAIYLRYSPVHDAYWWILVSLSRVTKDLILKLKQQLACDVSDVYLERISMDGTYSTLYQWTKLAEIDTYTWITGCVNCNIIYVSNPSSIRKSRCSRRSIIKLIISKHQKYVDTLSAANKNLSHNYKFYKYR